MVTIDHRLMSHVSFVEAVQAPWPSDLSAPHRQGLALHQVQKDIVASLPTAMRHPFLLFLLHQPSTPPQNVYGQRVSTHLSVYNRQLQAGNPAT